MCITATQICELDSVIEKLNSDVSKEEKMQCLANAVEDVEFLLKTLRKVNKKKLGNEKEKKKKYPAKENLEGRYNKENVIEFFQNNRLSDILEKNSKAELSAMYYAIYHSKPLSADNKERIAQVIKGYVRDMSRAEALLH